MFKRVLTTAVGLALLTGWTVAHGQEASNPEAVFEDLWQTFDRGYATFDVRGVDWDALYRIYRPRVTAATTDDELFAVLSELLSHLNDNHVMLSSENPERTFCAGYLGRSLNERGLAGTLELLHRRSSTATTAAGCRAFPTSGARA